ncbi:hypothetical protein [Candidatus Phytoplasma ziziphi]|uniref:hypothetical protein n=1 Tax=Ziziphus jujuba witches'-broom phytoplasma TaxID=135727 RepID=UPI001EDD8722|nr:hypothetical protein [Candidatus Phytoplasma ziziphi]
MKSQIQKICLLAVVPTIIIVIFMILKYWLVNKLTTPNAPIAAGVVEKQNKKETPNNGASGILTNDEVEKSGLILIEEKNTKAPETSNIGKYGQTPNDEVATSGLILIEETNTKVPETSNIGKYGKTPNNEVEKSGAILIEETNAKAPETSHIGTSGAIAIKGINKSRASKIDTSGTNKNNSKGKKYLKFYTKLKQKVMQKNIYLKKFIKFK